MKIAGIIVLVLGILSFLGAALAGHSVIGPLFWVAVGIALLYFANQKKEKEKEKNENSENNS